MVLIYGRIFTEPFDALMKNPSPCGDYGSYHADTMIDIICDELGIRPLAGIMVLICGRSGHRLHRYRRRIRPLAGIMVLIFKSPKGGNITFVDMNPSPCGDYGSYRDYLYPYFKGDRKGIRPLAGIMVLIGKKIPS